MPNMYLVEIEVFKELQQEAARWRYLRDHCISMSPATMHGPSHPVLYTYTDLWNERAHVSAKDRIQQAIDTNIKGSLNDLHP